MALISISKYHFVSQHCTYELLSLIDLSIADIEDDVWNVEDLLSENVAIFDVLKILFVFEKSGGVLVQNNKQVSFSVLLRDLDNIQFTSITSFWYNNEANGVIPVYDLGVIKVPDILPTFVATQQESGFWCIERLFRGEYMPLKNEKYLLEEIAKDRVAELNKGL